MAMTPDEDPELVVARARQRIEILEGLLRGADASAEIATAVVGCRDLAEARATLMAPPFGFTEVQAAYLLDTTFGRLTVDHRSGMHAEIDEMHAVIADPPILPPSPAGPRVAEAPTERPEFVRLVAGPDVERELAGGTLRVIGVELFHNSLRVLTRRTIDETVAPSRELFLHPAVSDDVGTEYGAWGNSGGAGGYDVRQAMDVAPAPPDGARLLTVTFDRVDLAFEVDLGAS